LECPIDAAPRCDRVSESEAGGDQSHDLLVASVAVAVQEIDGITASHPIRVASG
jgi:hypothetical protein